MIVNNTHSTRTNATQQRTPAPTTKSRNSNSPTLYGTSQHLFSLAGNQSTPRFCHQRGVLHWAKTKYMCFGHCTFFRFFQNIYQHQHNRQTRTTNTIIRPLQSSCGPPTLRDPMLANAPSIQGKFSGPYVLQACLACCCSMYRYDTHPASSWVSGPRLSL